ncbi:MAG TPA: HAMP domain-containing sensor histidine kinase [Nocardioides sp.]|uniref:sensor histidine kinase n=1 Tax=Nocardioides sp. TaxID=35761 RepID=UPI002C2EFD0F|nr:HAMP domain-containing sensor histidine kinase [Nocardioides sp.]HQR28441.1 HAMP domain-containing sensor histidine kinase [Nocardioides sp.]
MRGPRVPWPAVHSLTARLVATTVALVALVSVLVVGLTAFAMRDYLTGRLDDQVRGTPVKLSGQAPPPHVGEGSDDELDRFGQGPGTLQAVLLTDGRRGGEIIGGDHDEDGTVPLSTQDLAVLAGVPTDGQVHAVSLPDAGGYRVVARRASSSGTIVTGLPSSEITRTLASLLTWGLALAGVGVLLAAVLGLALVRRQLRPLREVAATAHEVSELPLSTGEINLSPRVPEHLTDERTEVGQVGAALNALLAHVETALEARHRSEQQVRQFVADASHELRTPLATIQGYTELARRRPEDQPGIRTALDKVGAESERMTSLVEDLLLLARLDAGRPLERSTVDLSRLLVEAVSDARVLSPEHRWRLDLPEDAVEVTGDEQRLHQVVTNLLSNARRYTPAGTTVTVTARPGLLTVHDDGPGFPPDLVGTAFERFARGDVARARNDEGGVGLGLSLVKAIVTAHGGTVALASRPGDTTVTVRLPARSPAPSGLTAD